MSHRSWEEIGNLTLKQTGIEYWMQIRNNKNMLLEYNKTLMQYLSIFQIRKEKDLPLVYNEFYENLKIEGSKIFPNETNLRFYANGHNDQSSFVSIYIQRCHNKTKDNPLYRGLDFLNVTCASSYEIDEFVKTLNAEYYFKYKDIDIQERNESITVFQ